MMMAAAATDKRASVDDFGPFAAPPPPSMRGAARTNPATASQSASRHARNDAAAPATVLPPMLTRATLLSPADVLQLMAPVSARVHAAPSSSSATPSLIDLSPELSPSAPPAAALVPVARARTSPLPQHAVVPSPAATAIHAAAAAPVPSVPAPAAPAADTSQYPHDELHADDAADALGHALAVSADTAHVPIPLAVEAHLVLALQLSNDYIDMYSRAARTARRAVPPAELVVVVDEDDGVLVVKCAAARPRARMAAFLSMALQALLATTPAARAQAGSPTGRAPSVRSPTTAVPSPRARSIAASVKSARSVASARSDMPTVKPGLDDESDSDDDNVPLHRAALLPAAPLSAPPARLPGIAPRPVPATAGAPRAQSLIMPRAPPAAASAAPAPPMTWPRQGAASDVGGVRRRTSALQLPVLPAQLLEHWPPYRDGAGGSSGLPSPAPPGAGAALPKPILMIPEASSGGARVAAFPPPPPAPTVGKGMAAASSPTRDSGVWGESAARLGL
ncbi:hypothetical protein GGF32_004806 [Allomyces javanicus]|nr:hypothetical protein GGF32_004806 [Allomyces javanicus]